MAQPPGPPRPLPEGMYWEDRSNDRYCMWLVQLGNRPPRAISWCYTKDGKWKVRQPPAPSEAGEIVGVHDNQQDALDHVYAIALINPGI